MGGERNDEGNRQFTCNAIQRPYRIGRYPVTVVQYQAFVEAGGYGKRRYWTDAGWAWRTKNKATGPESYRDVFQTPNHPQVGVSWYEAVAFCNWLSEQTGMEISLPTEAQWERAARHTDGRVYPWGDEGKPADHCNMGETGIGSTSAVGIFPMGNAECGAADMAGNVWEWCRTKWREDYQDYERRADDDLEGNAVRTLRGGSFWSSADGVRCAVRGGNSPDLRDVSSGFRVVFSSPAFGL